MIDDYRFNKIYISLENGPIYMLYYDRPSYLPSCRSLNDQVH